jgi:hypothetical protein
VGFSESSPNITFGNQSVGTTSAAQAVTLTNIGNTSLGITSIAVSGTNASDFTQTNNCGSSVTAGANCTISVTFTPSASGGRAASLTITSNAAISPQTVGLSGIGTSTSSTVSLSPASLAFGSQSVETTSTALTVTLTNTGNTSLTITGISVTGANASDFSEITTCPLAPGSVAANGSCTISVAFTPSASGNRTAWLTVADNATAGSPQAVSLVGTGTSAAISLSAAALSFGSQSVGTTSAAQGVTLTNGGNAALTISSIQVIGTDPGDFKMPSNTCGSSLAANASCTVNVTFTPTTSGSRTATLTFADSATNSPQSVSLTGTGTVPIAALSPASFSFTSQPAMMSSSPESFTLSNTGSAPLSITSIGFVGSNPGDFSQETTCGATLGANTTCTIAVLFTPAAAGSRSGTLVVTDNSNNVAGSTQTSTLAGTATHDVMLSWTASPTSGVVGYNIYRGITSGGENSTPLNSLPIDGTTYTDENVTAGVTYYYLLTAVTSAEAVQSAYSNEAAATVPSP